MVSFRVVERFVDAPLHVVSGVTDLALRRTDNGLVLYAATRAGGGVMALDVTGDMTLLGWQGLVAGQVLSAPSRLDMLELNGRDSLIVTGPNGARLTGFALGGDGDLGAGIAVAGSPAAVMTAQASVTVGAATFVYMTPINKGTLVGGRLEANGRMILVESVSVGPAQMGVQIADLHPVKVAGVTYLVVVSQARDAVMTYRVGTAGQLDQTGVLGAAEGLGVNDPTSVTSVMVSGQTYLLLTSPTTSSISVVLMTSTGTMAVTDHVIDTRDTRFQGISCLDAVSINGRAFVVAGGGDGGLDLLELVPGGRLVLRAQIVGTVAAPLDNISAISVVASGTGIDVFVAGEMAGVTRLRVELGDLAGPQRGTDADNVLTGGGAGDCLMGMGGSDRIYGGNGDDVIVDGSGADEMFGGRGADVFVIMPGGTTDIIRDFEVGIDRIDLSNWGRVFSMEALNIRERGGGVWLTFGNERVIIQGGEGNTLLARMFGTDDLFGLWHLLGPPAVAGRFLRGTASAEVMKGAGGDDVFRGSAGADTLSGGGGYDRVSYAESSAGFVIDMLFPRLGTGWAAGDRFTSIEAVSGSAGKDFILGSGNGDVLSGLQQRDTIQGREGHDRIYGDGDHDRLLGQAGSDDLYGGLGNDVLIGGSGADHLEGGAGRDSAVYFATGARGVTVDLRYFARNRGEAAGDSFQSVENVVGTARDDTLAGNSAANMLTGSAGRDWMAGREGNDSLFGGTYSDTMIGSDGADVISGGSGNDWVFGGLGRDRLTGGAGNDIAVYWGTGRGGVVADLSFAQQNTGSARGDSYVSIERLKGTAFSDRLGGNAQDNSLIGMHGNDVLIGRGGDDSVFGGSGRDRLAGNAGDDRLVGQSGGDAFVFDSGRDTVADFSFRQGDHLLIDRSLVRPWMDARDVVARFGIDRGAYVTLNFGDGDVLVLQGLSSLTNLHRAIDLF